MGLEAQEVGVVLAETAVLAGMAVVTAGEAKLAQTGRTVPVVNKAPREKG